jgi:hypothetical protein
MANRFPLTLDPIAQQIREISVGDSFDLTGNTVSSDLIPLIPNTYSIGGVGFQWLDVHAQNIYGALQTGSQPSIFEVGTISAGQWQASPVSTQYGGTGGALSPVAGAVLYSQAGQFNVTAVGASGQVLRSNGGAAPSWTSSLDLTDLNISSSLHLLDQKAIRFYEGGGGPNYVEMRAPLTIGSDYVLTLPADDGNPGEVMATDGSGNLSWTSPVGTFISAGDSGVYVTDPGVGGQIAFKTDNLTRWELNTAGHLIPSTDSTYDLGLNGQRVANVYADSYHGEIATNNQPNITGLGTVSSGTWSATVIDPLYGGTGVSNPSGRTITLGGSITTANSFQTSGNFPITLTATGNTSITLPTSGTLVSSSVTTLSSLTTVGSLLSLTCQGTTNLQAGVTLGSNATDTLTINSRLASDIIPSTDNARDLGGAGYRFAEVWASLAYLNEVRLPTEGPVKFYEAAVNGTDYVGFQAPTSITGTVIWKLPPADGGANQVLKTDGAGNLSWAAGSAVAAGGSTTQVQYNSGGSLTGSANMTFDGSTLTVLGLTVNNAASFNGSTTTFGNATSDAVVFNARVNSDLLPSTDNTRNLGSASNRWANIYTGDLHLKNERGDWTIIEEEDALTIRNNKTGRVYDIMMTPRGS